MQAIKNDIVGSLKKQIADLTAENNFLKSQNKRLLNESAEYQNHLQIVNEMKNEFCEDIKELNIAKEKYQQAINELYKIKKEYNEFIKAIQECQKEK